VNIRLYDIGLKGSVIERHDACVRELPREQYLRRVAAAGQIGDAAWRDGRESPQQVACGSIPQSKRGLRTIHSGRELRIHYQSP
jgi:hypothetical protein